MNYPFKADGRYLRGHVRLVESVYEHAVPSIATCDALILDALHLAPPVILASLDAVARRIRGSRTKYLEECV